MKLILKCERMLIPLTKFGLQIWFIVMNIDWTFTQGSLLIRQWSLLLNFTHFLNRRWRRCWRRRWSHSCWYLYWYFGCCRWCWFWSWSGYKSQFGHAGSSYADGGDALVICQQQQQTTYSYSIPFPKQRHVVWLYRSLVLGSDCCDPMSTHFVAVVVSRHSDGFWLDLHVLV